MPSVLVHCAVCGDVAYNRARVGDAPWSDSVDGEGVVCSPLCEVRDALAHHRNPGERVAAVRDAMLNAPPGGLPVEGWALDVLGCELDPAVTVIVSEVIDVHRDALRAEVAPDGEAVTIAWADVIDAREVTS